MKRNLLGLFILSMVAFQSAGAGSTAYVYYFDRPKTKATQGIACEKVWSYDEYGTPESDMYAFSCPCANFVHDEEGKVCARFETMSQESLIPLELDEAGVCFKHEDCPLIEDEATGRYRMRKDGEKRDDNKAYTPNPEFEKKQALVVVESDLENPAPTDLVFDVLKGEVCQFFSELVENISGKGRCERPADYMFEHLKTLLVFADKTGYFTTGDLREMACLLQEKLRELGDDDVWDERYPELFSVDGSSSVAGK